MSPAGPPAAAPALRWVASTSRPPGCGRDHGGVPGVYDERARRVGHAELAAARLLVAEGHLVRSLPDPKGGPGADFEACGVPVEVKTLVPQAERPGGRPANGRSLYNRLVSGNRQGPVVLVMAAGSGLTASAAEAGLRRFATAAVPGRARAVRVVGDGWDLAWVAARGAEVDRAARPARLSGRPSVPPSGWRAAPASRRRAAGAGARREIDGGPAGLG